MQDRNSQMIDSFYVQRQFTLIQSKVSMQDSKLSSHLGSSDSDEFAHPAQRLKQFEDLPGNPFSKLPLLYQQLRYILIQNNIKEGWIIGALSKSLVKGLDTLFALKSASFSPKCQEFFELCEKLLNTGNDLLPSEIKQACVPEKIDVLEEKPEKIQDIFSQKLKFEEQKKKVQFSSQSTGISNIYAKESFNDEIEQKKISELSPSVMKLLDDMSYPVTWEDSPNFEVEDRKIKKIFNDNYRKICSKHSLDEYENYKIKFKVTKMGTVAIGLVPSEKRDGIFIDDRKINVFKYIAFENEASGIIKLNKGELAKGKKYALHKGDEVELIFDRKMMIVTLKTSNLEKTQIPVQSLRNSKLYLFVQMKQQNTEIQFM